jgi:hypothetical protein
VERSFKRHFFIVDTGIPFAPLKTLSNLHKGANFPADIGRMRKGQGLDDLTRQDSSICDTIDMLYSSDLFGVSGFSFRNTVSLSIRPHGLGRIRRRAGTYPVG